MTLAELAALAAKVEGLVRPGVPCSRCKGAGSVFLDRLGRYTTCGKCKCALAVNGVACSEFDNSPAALLMAVWVFTLKSGRRLHTRDWAGATEVLISSGFRRRIGVSKLPDVSEESIARAALVALLRAHGVEVPNAE